MQQPIFKPPIVLGILKSTECAIVLVISPSHLDTKQLSCPKMTLNTYKQYLLMRSFPHKFLNVHFKTEDSKSSQLNRKFYIIGKNKMEQSTYRLEWEKTRVWITVYHLLIAIGKIT